MIPGFSEYTIFYTENIPARNYSDAPKLANQKRVFLTFQLLTWLYKPAVTARLFIFVVILRSLLSATFCQVNQSVVKIQHCCRAHITPNELRIISHGDVYPLHHDSQLTAQPDEPQSVKPNAAVVLTADVSGVWFSLLYLHYLISLPLSIVQSIMLQILGAGSIE